MKNEKCNFWKTIKRGLIKIGSLCLKNFFIIILVIVSCIMIYVFHKVKPTFDPSTENYIGYIISGILGSILSACIVLLTLTNETKVSKANAHMKLRELFFTEPRMRIHELLLLYQNLCNIGKQDEIHLLENDKIKQQLNLEENVINFLEINKNVGTVKEAIENALQKDIANLYDYLGIFEIASKMLDDDVLDKKLFKDSYGYRIKAIRYAFDNMKFLQNQDKKYWKTLLELVDRFDVD